MSDIWTRLDELVDTYDASFDVNVASSCCWSGQLRVTLTNPGSAPSRSMTFFSAGGGTPEEVARRCIDDFETWLEESGTTPLPVPDWMKP